MDQHSWQAICALAAVIQGLMGGIIRYLLKEIDKRDKTIEKQNLSATSTNKLNEQLAALYVEERQAGRGNAP